MSPGDYVQYNKYYGKIIFKLGMDMYLVEVYNYRGFNKIFKEIEGYLLYKQEIIV